MIGLMLSVSSGLALGKEGPTVHIACCWANVARRMPENGCHVLLRMATFPINSSLYARMVVYECSILTGFRLVRNTAVVCQLICYINLLSQSPLCAVA